MQTILREMPMMVGLRLLILNKIKQQKCSILMTWRLMDFKLLMVKKRIRLPKEELALPVAGRLMVAVEATVVVNTATVV